MQKVVGVYLIFLVVGAIIGASVVTFVTMSQNPSIKEQVKVTIQGIDYTSSDSVLKIELLNNVPETNLEGKIIVSQDDNQWTSDVTWYYTGHGEVEVICDSIDETQNFRITYNENYPEATYLDRIIEWNEIIINQGSTSRQAGASGTLTITITDVVAGNKYSVSLFATDGTLVGSYTDTA
jgi:hypothetical protein